MQTIRMSQVVGSLLFVSLLAGCVAPQQNGGFSQTEQNNNPQQAQDPCSVGQSALAGAAVGALLGSLIDGKKGAIKGAALGGATAVVGCLAINSQSRQTKTAAQTDREYVQARGSLPREPQVLSYVPQVSNSVVQRGKPVRVNSVVELVNGSVTPVREVREELVVFDTRGERFKSGSKPLTNNTGGRFENTFELSLPPEASQGAYALKTNLYVNNKLVATRDMRTQLVWNGSTGVLVAGL